MSLVLRNERCKTSLTVERFNQGALRGVIFIFWIERLDYRNICFTECPREIYEGLQRALRLQRKSTTNEFEGGGYSGYIQKMRRNQTNLIFEFSPPMAIWFEIILTDQQVSAVINAMASLSKEWLYE